MERDVCDQLNLNLSDDRKSGPKRDFSETLEEDDNDEYGDNGEEIDDFSHPLIFKSIHCISYWLESSTMTKKCTAAILLPSGIDCQNVLLRYVLNANYVEIKVRWPQALYDPHTLLRSAIRTGNITGHHPKLAGFENALFDLRTVNHDPVWSTAKISFDIDIQSIEGQEIMKFANQQPGDSNRTETVDLERAPREQASVILVELTGPTSQYSAYTKKRSFKYV